MKKILVYQDDIQQVLFKKNKKNICFYEHRLWDINQVKWIKKQEWLVDDTEFCVWYFKKNIPNFFKKIGLAKEVHREKIIV